MAFKNKQGSSKGFRKEPTAPSVSGPPHRSTNFSSSQKHDPAVRGAAGGPPSGQELLPPTLPVLVSPPPCPDPENTQHPPRPGVRSALPPPAPGSAQVSLGAQNLAREPLKRADRTCGSGAASPCPRLAGQSADMLTHVEGHTLSPVTNYRPETAGQR